MDLLGELEAMANTATIDTEASMSDIKRWQRLFGFTIDEARKEIEAYRGDLSKKLVPHVLWNLVEDVKEPLEFDIEAYSYSLEFRRSPQQPKGKVVRSDNATYIVKLGGPISTPEDIQVVAGLEKLPVKSTGQGETGEAEFCTISSSAKDQVLEWLASNHPTYTPTIVRLSKSAKELGSYSLAPFIGQETTLPHQRANTVDFEPLPRQNEYPVWYFFYDLLLEPKLLQRQLGLAKEPVCRPAQIQGAKMRSWQGKYKAIADGSDEDIVEGGAFLVKNAQQEDSLKFFETDMYEIVRCRIRMSDGLREEVPGLVFRFCGLESELV